MKHMKHVQYVKQKNKRLEVEDQDDESCGQLGYSVSHMVLNNFKVNIDEPVVEPRYYREVFHMLLEAGENDIVSFFINSPGGNKNGLLTLLEGIKLTQATTKAVIVGEAHSAASILALHCDELYVSDSATMLCHHVRYGVQGKDADILAHALHTSQTSSDLIKDTYKDFLSDAEIQDILSGKELWLTAEEIKERAVKRDIIEAEREVQELEQEAETEVETKPTKQRAKKKNT